MTAPSSGREMGVLITELRHPHQPPLQPSSQQWGRATLPPSHTYSSGQGTQGSKGCMGVEAPGQRGSQKQAAKVLTQT